MSTFQRMKERAMDPGESFEHYAKHEGYVEGWNDCLDALFKMNGPPCGAPNPANSPQNSTNTEGG